MPERPYKEATVSAEDQFTDWLNVDGQLVDIHIENVSSSTVTLQKRFSPTGDIFDEASYTADAHKVLSMPGIARYRLGVKTGDYGGDSPFLRLQVGPQ